MNILFEYLSNKNINPDNLSSTIHSWNDTQLTEFIAESLEIDIVSKEKATTLFSFSANEQLSAGGMYCSSFNCRMNEAEILSRFASLYADVVYIYNPLDKFEGIEEWSESAVENLFVDLSILFKLKPLIEFGVIQLAPGSYNLCHDCFDKLGDKHSKVTDYLRSRISNEVNYFIEKETYEDMDFHMIKTVGPEDIYGHPETFITGIDEEKLIPLLNNKKQVKLNSNQINDFGLIEDKVDEIFIDLINQNANAELYNTNYVSNNSLNSNLSAALNTPQQNLNHKALMEGLAHSVPYIHNTSVDNLLELREKEFDSFLLYRDSISRLLKEVDTTNVKQIKEALDDVVTPEILKMNHTVKNSKKILGRNINKDLIVGSGFIGLGIYDGVLPNDIASIVGALGGYKFISSLLSKHTDKLSTPKNVMDSNYHFIWQVNQMK